MQQRRNAGWLDTLKARKSSGQKLSKTGEWLLKHPNGIGLEIRDYHAVMR
jgi:hypothetical protein